LANTRSAIKRVRQNPKRRLRNRYFTGRARTFVKKAFESMDSEDPKAAQEATLVAIRALDKAAEKGTLHKNNVARRKSRLMKHLNTLGK
jgi:small subunit ribosomal protein S20